MYFEEYVLCIKELKLLASKKTADTSGKSLSDSSSNSDTEAGFIIESNLCHVVYCTLALWQSNSCYVA